MTTPTDRAAVYASLARMAAEMGARYTVKALDSQQDSDWRAAQLYFEAGLELAAIERATRENPKLVE